MALSKNAIFAAAQENLTDGELSAALATAALAPIAEQVIENAKMRQLLLTDRISSGASIEYQLKKRGIAYVFPRYGLPATRIVRYTKFAVEPWLIATRPKISILDIQDANFNVVTDILEDAGKEMAVMEDKEGFRLFNVGATLPGTAWPTAGSDEWPTISDGPGGIGRKLSTNIVRLDGGTVPVLQDFIRAQSLLRVVGYEPNGLLMNPYTLGKLMATNEFLLYTNSGSREVVETGNIRGALGVDIVTSNLCGLEDTWILDTKEAARFVERNPLIVVAKTDMLINEWLLWERIAVVVLNANAMIRLSYDEDA